MAATIGLVLGALLISILHAALPTHWLPFVLVGRARKWGKRRVMMVAFLAAVGHVTATIVLGFFIFVIGFKIAEHAGHFVHLISGLILIVFGVFFCVNHLLHAHHEHCRAGNKEFISDRAAILSLLGVLTFSPCEAILPVFLAAGTVGFKVVIPLLGIILVSTVAVMLTFVYFAASGIEKIKSKVFEEYENLIIGLVLIILGLLVIFVFE